MATFSWSLVLGLMMMSPVTYAFLTHVIRDSRDAQERQERALERLQEVFGLPGMGEKRHHQTPPQFMTELYNDIAERSSVRKKNPYNAKVIRSFVERDNSMSHFFFFNISGLDATEEVLEAQLRLYRLRAPPHHTFYTSPSLILRVYQVLDEHHIATPDLQRLLSSHMGASQGHGWEVFNVKEAVLDWVSGRRPNKGLLVTATDLFEQHMDVKFARRNEHHNSKQPILVLFDDEVTGMGSPNYFEYNSVDEEADAARRRRSVSSSTTNPISRIRSHLNINNTAANNTHNSMSECQRHELIVNFEKIGWSSWIISPKNYSAYHCKGHCNFPLGQSLRPTNHATVQSIIHELDLSPHVDKPCCVPTSLRELHILYTDDDDNVVLKTYDDMIADSCGCH